MLEIRRRAAARAAQEASAQGEQGAQRAGEEPVTLDGENDISRILAELIRDGTVTLQEDDGDEEYVDVEEGEGGDEDEMEVDEDDEDDEEGDGLFGYHTVRGHAPPPARSHWEEEIKEPKQEGLDLLYSGEFGRIQHQIHSRNKAGSAAKFLLNRGSRIRPSHREDFATVRS